MAYVTLEEAKKHLNIDADFTDDDDYVTSLISAAEKVVALDICVPLEELEEEPGKIPAPLRQAVLLMVGNYYVKPRIRGAGPRDPLVQASDRTL